MSLRKLFSALFAPNQEVLDLIAAAGGSRRMALEVQLALLEDNPNNVKARAAVAILAYEG